MSGHGSRMLRQAADQLTDKQTAVLRFLQAHRLATTVQLARMHRGDHATASSALRQTARALKRMATLHLVRTLDRRVGGARAGSTGLVWSLTDTGARLLRLIYGVGHARRYRATEPGAMFTEHTLAVTELVVRLDEALRNGLVERVVVEPEPDCWRRYLGPHGVLLTLKPDLSASTTTAEYADEWFFEVDQGTENPARVVAKCQQYAAHRQQGTEQRDRGVYPAVVWFTSTPERQATLQRHLEAPNARIPPGMVTITTIDRLDALLTGGVDAITSSTNSSERRYPDDAENTT